MDPNTPNSNNPTQPGIQVPQMPQVSQVQQPFEDGGNPRFSFSGITKILSIGLGGIVLLAGLGLTVISSQQKQDIQQHASVSSPVCVTYNQKDTCASAPDAVTKTGTTFIIDKCGSASSPSYSCFDPGKGQYYTQKDTCSTGPLGPTDSSKKGHTLLVRKLVAGGKTTYSCVADCTVNPATPHCPSVSSSTPTPTIGTTPTPTPSLSPTPDGSGDSPTSTPTDSPTGSISPTTGAIKTGDVNLDGTVDIVDYQLLMACYEDNFTTPSCTAGPAADLNQDGKVDGIDYNIFLRAMLGE